MDLDLADYEIPLQDYLYGQLYETYRGSSFFHFLPHSLVLLERVVAVLGLEHGHALFLHFFGLSRVAVRQTVLDHLLGVFEDVFEEIGGVADGVGLNSESLQVALNVVDVFSLASGKS